MSTRTGDRRAGLTASARSGSRPSRSGPAPVVLHDDLQHARRAVAAHRHQRRGRVLDGVGHRLLHHPERRLDPGGATRWPSRCAVTVTTSAVARTLSASWPKLRLIENSPPGSPAG